ncbi:hat family dimerization domaincontaining protein-related [Holotrichia oblita]|uniref:Hat family dimerization domaincontaining protein-related n=1 Tax=Holotrichia oblita TaxID=644536 RepID=A0ACB9SG09_HOLOL|nr:hat family dimerization domaincontaining protein-related [Holotrichia oblita]
MSAISIASLVSKAGTSIYANHVAPLGSHVVCYDYSSHGVFQQKLERCLNKVNAVFVVFQIQTYQGQCILSLYWTEEKFGKGSNEIASAVFDRLNKIDFGKNDEQKILRLVADGCSGQNKNSTLIGMCSKWLVTVPLNVASIELVFPVTGHSFLPPDRVFGQIERKLRKREVIAMPSEYVEIFSESATTVELGQECRVFDWKTAVQEVLKPSGSWGFKFKECKRYFLKRVRSGNVVIRGEVNYKNDLGTFVGITKKGKTTRLIDPDEISSGNHQVKPLKLRDVATLLAKHFEEGWRALQDLSYYANVIPEQIENIETEEESHNVPDTTCEFIPELPAILYYIDIDESQPELDDTGNITREEERSEDNTFEDYQIEDQKHGNDSDSGESEDTENVPVHSSDNVEGSSNDNSNSDTTDDEVKIVNKNKYTSSRGNIKAPDKLNFNLLIMPKDKKKYSQKYTKIWETDPDVKDWLAPDVTNDTLVNCKYCHVVLKAHKKDLVGHAKTEKHNKATAREKSAKIIKLIECDAKSVHDAIISQLKIDGLKFENMIGVGVDGANVMAGRHNSVTAILKRELPDLIVVKCVSHSLHLCAEKAAELLPRQLEFLVREAHNWFSYSPKRLEYYKTLFETINANKDPKKIQGLSGTRWLARYQAINTILEQWEELKLLFSIAKSDDKCYMAEQLYDIMRRTPFKAFLIFLKNELKNVTQLNLLFQSDDVEPTKLFEDLFLLYKNLLRRLVVPSQLEKLVDCELVEFNFQEHLMHTASMYFGFDFQNISQELTAEDLLDVRERCKNFLCCLAEQIQKRLPDNLSMLKIVADLHPKVATSQVKPDLKPILNYIQRTHIYGNKNDIESEWHQLSNKTWSNTSTSADFYFEVYNDCDAAGCKRFGNVSKFGLAFVTVPIWNASVERAFSVYNIVKNKLRNRLSIEMLQSLMMVRFTLQRNGGSCITFNPSTKMLSLFNIEMYDFKKSEPEENEIMFEMLNN